MQYSSNHLLEYFCGVAIKANSLFFNFSRAIRFAVIQASVCCLPVVSRHLPEGILDDDRGVGSDSDLQIQHTKIFVSAKKIGIRS